MKKVKSVGRPNIKEGFIRLTEDTAYGRMQQADALSRLQSAIAELDAGPVKYICIVCRRNEQVKDKKCATC